MSLIGAVTAGVLVSLALNSTPGATSSPAERPAGPAVAQTPPYEISETIDFADRADYRIDSDRVAELDEILRGAGSSDVIAPCPLGDPGGMLAGLALESTPADAVAELYGLASDNRDASFQSDPEVSCLEAGLDVSYSRSDQPLTVDRALAWTSHRGFSSVSEPVPFFEGEAFTYCSEDGDSCGATWFDRQGLWLNVSNWVNPTSRTVGTWLETTVPVVLGTPEVAARATALDTAGEVGLMTEDGYSVDATYEFRTGPITIDPTASAPGETEVVIPTSGSVGLVNTTSERETSVASIGLSSRALYPLAGDVCQTLMASEEVLVASSDDYCFLKLGSGVDWSMTEDDVLPPDGTSTRTTADLVTDDVSETRLVVPAVEAEMLADQLRDPAGLVLSAPYESNPWTDGSDYWADDDPCLTDLNVGSTELTFLFFATSETPSDYCPPPPDHGDGGIYFTDPFA